jgi:type I restriction enzyme M protein
MIGHISQQQLEAYLWGAATLLRGTIDAGDYKQFIFPLLFFKRLCDVFDEEIRTALAESDGDQEFALFPENHRFQIPFEAHWREVRQVTSNVGQALQNAMRAIETANPDKLYGIFGDAQWTNKNRLSDAMLRDLIEHFSTLDLTLENLPEDELGNGYEYLIKKFADDSGHTAAEFYTNRTVVHLMTEMLEPQPGESIYDPTCGSGGMLLSCIAHLRRKQLEWRNVRLYGQERNLMTSSIARMNCFLHGIEDFRIERGDTLSEPKFVQGDRLMRFDMVLANPPYSIKQWDRNAFASDPWGRNLYGTPPQGRADYAFWQHILLSLAPRTGRCAILFPHGVLFRQEEAEMRRKLIEADLIECVLGLGPKLFYNASMEACVVICRTAKSKARRGKILFINAVNEFTRERTQSFLTDEHIQRIVAAYNSFENESAFANAAALDEVRENDHSLKIDLYVATPSASNGNVIGTEQSSELPSAIAAWSRSRIQVRYALSSVFPDLKRAVHEPEELKVKALEEIWRQFDRAKWTRVRFGDVVRFPKESVDPNSGELDRYIAGDHMDTENVHLRRWGTVGDGYLGPAFIRRFRKGQVLYGSRRTYLKKVAYAEFDGITANTTFVLEGVEGKLHQPLLPWLMLSQQFTEHSVRESKGSTNPYINFPDIAKFEFALPALDQQRRIAEIIWAVDECRFEDESLKRTLLEYHRTTLNEACGVDVEKRLLGNIVSYASDGPFGSKLKTEHYADHGARVIRLQNIGKGHFDDTDKAFIASAYWEELKRYQVRAGDVIVAGLGDDTHPVGRATVIPETLGPAVNKADCFCIRSNNSTVLNPYLAYFLNSGPGRDQVAARAQGTTRLRINVGNLKTVTVPILTLHAQSELVEKLRNIETAMAEVDRCINVTGSAINTLLNSILGV